MRQKTKEELLDTALSDANQRVTDATLALAAGQARRASRAELARLELLLANATGALESLQRRADEAEAPSMRPQEVKQPAPKVKRVCSPPATAAMRLLAMRLLMTEMQRCSRIMSAAIDEAQQAPLEAPLKGKHQAAARRASLDLWRACAEFRS